MFAENRITIIQLESLGEVKLKGVSIGDLIFIEQLLRDRISNRDFVLKVILHQIVSPKIEEQSFGEISDDDLTAIGYAFIEAESSFFEYFQDNDDLYSDFRQALVKMEKIRSEELRAELLPILKSAQGNFTDFNQKYRSIIQQALTTTSFIQESIATTATLSSQISNVNLSAIETMRTALEQFGSIANTLNQSLGPQIDILQKWVNVNPQIFDSSFRHWEELRTKHKIAETEATHILRKYKWFITPSLPADFIGRIVSIGKRGGRQDKAINTLFIEYFEENNWRNLRSMSTEWKTNPLLGRRYKIFSDCVETLRLSRKTRYNAASVVLPTLIIQIDGLISDFLRNQGLSWKTLYDDRVDWKSGRVNKTGRKTLFRNTKPAVLSGQLDDLANEIFLNILFQKYWPGKPLATPFNFNRHKIIHGESVRYGRKDYVVRAFLVLDFLADIGASDS